LSSGAFPFETRSLFELVFGSAGLGFFFDFSLFFSLPAELRFAVVDSADLLLALGDGSETC